MDNRRLIAVFLAVLFLTGFSKAWAKDDDFSLHRQDQPVTIWHIPHPDDETLGMAGALMAAVEKGERNLVVIYTDGGGSDVRHVINGLFYCPIHRRFHRPAEEGYEPLSRDDFAQARLRETKAAMAILGIASDDVITVGFADGSLRVADALQVMKELDALYPHAAHRTTSLTDAHPDHRTLARALYRLIADKKEAGETIDTAFYSVYRYGKKKELRGQGAVRQIVPDPDKKRAALDEFALWRPEEGRFAVGIHSVPSLFEAAAADEAEYADVPPSRLSLRHVRAYETGLRLFSDGTTVDWPLSPRFSLQFGIAFDGKADGPAVTYRFPFVSSHVHIYTGVTFADDAARPVTFHLAGVRLFRRLLMEYRFSPEKEGTFRLGWELTL